MIEKNNKKVGIIKFNLKEDKGEMLKMLHLLSLKKRVRMIKDSIQTSNKKKTIQKNRKKFVFHFILCMKNYMKLISDSPDQALLPILFQFRGRNMPRRGTTRYIPEWIGITFV